MSEKLPLRLYGEATCPHCVGAVAFLQALNVPLQTIVISSDPVIKAGLDSLFKGEQKIPVIVSMLTNEVITGFQPDDYERIGKRYIEEFSPNPSNEVAAKVNDTKPVKKSGKRTTSQA